MGISKDSPQENSHAENKANYYSCKKGDQLIKSK